MPIEDFLALPFGTCVLGRIDAPAKLRGAIGSFEDGSHSFAGMTVPPPSRWAEWANTRNILRPIQTLTMLQAGLVTSNRKMPTTF
jgi:hypothetical protein